MKKVTHKERTFGKLNNIFNNSAFFLALIIGILWFIFPTSLGLWVILSVWEEILNVSLLSNGNPTLTGRIIHYLMGIGIVRVILEIGENISDKRGRRS